MVLNDLENLFVLGSHFGGERQGSKIGAGAATHSSQWREGKIRHFGGKSDSSLYIRPNYWCRNFGVTVKKICQTRPWSISAFARAQV